MLELGDGHFATLVVIYISPERFEFLFCRFWDFQFIPYSLEELEVVQSTRKVGVDALEERLPVLVHGALAVPGRADPLHRVVQADYYST